MSGFTPPTVGELSTAQQDALDSIVNLPDNAVPKSVGGQLIASGTNVDPITDEHVFDKSVVLPQASADLGLAKLSEGGGFVLISNPLSPAINFALTDSRFDDTGSFPPRYFNLDPIRTENVQTTDTTVITTNPLLFSLTTSLLAQTNKLIFKANGPMTNVSMKIVDNTFNEPIKYVPSRAAFDNGAGGINLIAGLNTIDFISQLPDTPGVINIGLTPFRLFPSTQLDITIKAAGSIDLLGDATNFPFLDAEVQDAKFTDLAILAQSGIEDKAVLFVNSDSELTSDSTNFNWDNVNKRLSVLGNVGIGTTASANQRLSVQGSSSTATGDGSELVEIRDNRITAESAPNYIIGINRQNSPTAALYVGNDGNNDVIIAGNNGDFRFGNDNAGNFTELMRLKKDGKFILRDDGFEIRSNYIIKTPNLVGTTAQTSGTVEAYQKTSVVATVTNGQFTAGDVLGPSVDLDSGTPIFSASEFVLVEGDLDNDGIYEVDFNLGFSLTFRGFGGTAREEDWTLDDVVTKLATVTITKLKVSVERTSLTGTKEHGEGDTAPITYFRFAHADDVPSVVAEEFAAKESSYNSELGLPSVQGFTDTVTGAATITLQQQTVFGIVKNSIEYDIPDTGDTAKSDLAISQEDWDFNLINGFSFRGEGFKIVKDIDTQSCFVGAGFSTARDPRPTSIQSRVGIFKSVDATHSNIRLDGQSTITLNGIGGVPLVLKDTHYNYEVFVDETPDAGLNFGPATLFVNNIQVSVGAIIASNSAVNDIMSVQNSSSSGSTTFSFVNFGMTIYQEGSIKTLSIATMQASIAQVKRPRGKRNHTVILPDGNPRRLGNTLEFLGGSIGTELNLQTENPLAPQTLFNGLNELTIKVISEETISFINTVDIGNIYRGIFKSEEDIIYAHSGIISSGDNGGPKGMSIVNATTFRLEPITSVIVDRSLNTNSPVQTFFDLPQTDHVITGGGDQIVNTYINNQGEYEFRPDEPKSFSVTGETFVGKAVMAAGVITVAVFTPVVAYAGSVDEAAELINGGGHKTSGSILSAAGSNLTLSITDGNHHQLGRGFLDDPNSPNLCGTEGRAIVAFTGTTGNLFLVHADSGGNFIIDAFISNSANPDIDPAQFNDGGTLATVPVNDFTAQRVYQACGTNDIIIYYGTVAYANMAAAEAGFESEDPELLTTRDISYICTIIIKETVTDLAAGVIAGDVIFKNRSGDREL